MVCRDCLGRTPFPSLVATVVCCGGVGLFCGALYRALDITLRGIFLNLFNIHVDWLYTIQIVFIITAVMMGCFSFLLLIFGFLATGATRQNIYSGAKCIMGGRVSAAFFMVLTYILNGIWIAVTSACALPILAFLMLNSICVVEIENREESSIWYYDNYCLNLSRFGIYINETDGRKNAICEYSELGEFCQHVKDAQPMYGMAFGASLLIVLGMVCFLIIIGVNYERIKYSEELTEYRDAVDLELQESKVMENPKVF